MATRIGPHKMAAFAGSKGRPQINTDSGRINEPMDDGTDDVRTGSHTSQIQIESNDLAPMFLRPEIPHISYRMNRFCPHPCFPWKLPSFGTEKRESSLE